RELNRLDGLVGAVWPHGRCRGTVSSVPALLCCLLDGGVAWLEHGQQGVSIWLDRRWRWNWRGQRGSCRCRGCNGGLVPLARIRRRRAGFRVAVERVEQHRDRNGHGNEQSDPLH